MSDAKASSQDIFSIALCSQCLQEFTPSVSRDVFHAVPCGHVFCKDCMCRVEAEQKSGKSLCRRAGCERELAHVSMFAVSWVAQRAERIKANRKKLFPGQGNVGDLPPPVCTECDADPDTGKPHLATHRCDTCGDGVFYCAEVASLHPRLKASKGHTVVAIADALPPKDAEPAWEICAEHKLPFRVVEASTHLPLCSECLIAARGKAPFETFDEAIVALETADAVATSAELARQKIKLTEPIFTADELRAKTTKWGAEETARIRAWEEREVKHVQEVANETVKRVQELCARKIEVGASLITQRMGLRASLEEFDQALADLPSDPAARLSKKRAVYTQRQRLCELLATSKIDVATAWAATEWAEPPSPFEEFDEKAADGGGILASKISAASMSALSPARAGPPRTYYPPRKDWREFPVIPSLERPRADPTAPWPRSIRLGATPTVFAELDDDTAVIGFHGMAPLIVLDLATGRVSRRFHRKGGYCMSMIYIPDGRIAVGWNNDEDWVVAILDVNTGKQLQELGGLGDMVTGLALVEGHLLTLSRDKILRVWSQDAAGKFTEIAKFTVTSEPFGAITVLGPSRVAVPTTRPASIEVWDWRAGKQVRIFTGFGGDYVRANALLPDGRFVAGDDAGTIRVGSLDNWAAATVISNGDDGLTGVLAVQDRSFVTTDRAGKLKLWKNGVCTAMLAGCIAGSEGALLFVVGRRLLVVGSEFNLLVFD